MCLPSGPECTRSMETKEPAETADQEREHARPNTQMAPDAGEVTEITPVGAEGAAGALTVKSDEHTVAEGAEANTAQSTYCPAAGDALGMMSVVLSCVRSTLSASTRDAVKGPTAPATPCACVPMASEAVVKGSADSEGTFQATAPEEPWVHTVPVAGCEKARTGSFAAARMVKPPEAAGLMAAMVVS
jgi:hypothetical protein